MNYYLTHPSSLIAKTIENIVEVEKNSSNILIKSGSFLLSRAVSVIVFPLFCLLELTLKKIPNTLPVVFNDKSRNKKLDKIVKYVLSIICSPIGIYVPEAIPGFFLKSPKMANVISPFGVEQLYGKKVNRVIFPESEQEIIDVIKKAKTENKKISIVGAGMSQGTQTVPENEDHVVLNLKKLKSMNLAEDGKTVEVQAGAIWEELQYYLNQNGKSAIVKQASDLFSIGGSLGINCHGWAHEYGAISSTVEELTVIDSSGKLIKLKPEDEYFKCFFGTLGYFGVIVSAKLKVLDNDHLIEKTEIIESKDFSTNYQERIKSHDYPLFGGRLILDSMDGNPLRQVCMVRYEKDQDLNIGGEKVVSRFEFEAKTGARIERIGLKLFAHLSNFSVRRFTRFFWKREEKMMLEGRKLTRNEALHPPINAFRMLQQSKLHTQWLQEYFIKPEKLSEFLNFLGPILKENDVRLVNATIRPVPKDSISLLPYAEEDRYAVVICFSQEKSQKAIAKTKNWIEKVHTHLSENEGVFYQAYMPYATREQFEQCYGKERVEELRRLKGVYDPDNIFSNEHTVKYFD